MRRERGRRHPGRIAQYRVIIERRDGALEMQAARHFHGYHRVSVGLDESRQLGNTRVVGARRSPHVESTAHLHHVATVERPGRFDADQRAILGQYRGDGLHFRTSAWGARPGDHGQFVEHDGGVLDEHRVGIVGCGRYPSHLTAECAQRRFVLLVLRLGPRRIDGEAVEVREFTGNNRGTHGAGERQQRRRCGHERLRWRSVNRRRRSVSRGMFSA